MFAFGWSSCGRKPECSDENHLSDHMAIQHADAGYRTRFAALRDECHPVNFELESRILIDKKV